VTTHACPELVLLDGYLDGDLTPDEVAAYERHAAACATCSEEMALARRMSSVLAEPIEEAPPSVLAGALARIEAGPAPRTAPDRPARTGVRLRRVRLAALALAASSIIAALAVIPQLQQRRQAAADEPNPAEVAAARADIERALGLVGEATRDAGVFLRDDVLAPHVAEPAAESVMEALGLSN
jgi:anti-sigma factor RsiW